MIDSPTFTTVTGTAAPTAGTHLANKTYVDSTVSGSSFWSLSGNEIDSAAGRYVDINSHAAIGTSSTPGTNVGLAV